MAFTATDADDEWDGFLDATTGDNVSFQHHVLHEIMLYVADSQSYFQAVARCPEVLEAETPHDMYLQFCKHNAAIAARQLAKYWTMRLETFGGDLAFLPLPLALTTDEWKFIQTGGFALLTASEQSDRSILFIDKLRIDESTLRSEGAQAQRSLEIRKRCLFYLLHLMQHQWRRFDVLIRVDYMSDLLLSGGKLDESEQELVQLALTLSQTAMCLQSYSLRVHLLATNAPQNAQYDGAATLRTILGTLPGGGAENVCVHMGDDGTIASSLQRHGFDLRHLPATLGGSWTYEKDWSRFVANQFDAEHGAPIVRPLTPLPSPPEAGLPKGLPAAPWRPSFWNHPVHEAIDLVTSNEAYLRAVQVCPEVVQDETPHERYHKFMNCNPWDAAQRLANYWTLRVKVFGQEDAFMPLRVALRPEDKAFVFRGASFLPPPILDDDGNKRAVYFIDRSIVKAPPPPSEYPTRFRAAFYKFHLMMEEAESGFVFLIRLNNSYIATFRTDRMWIGYLRKLATEAMCLGPCSDIHAVSINPPPGFASALVIRTLLFKVLGKVSPWMKTMKQTLHMGKQSEVALSLQKFGFTAADLPIRCGGAWDALNPEWMKWRFRSGIRLDESYEVDSLGRHRQARGAIAPASKISVSAAAMGHREAEAPVPIRYQRGTAEQPSGNDIFLPALEGAFDRDVAKNSPPLRGLDLEPIPLRDAGTFVDCEGLPRSSSCDYEAVRQRVSDDKNSSSFLGVDFEAKPATSAASNSPSLALGDPRAESVSIPPLHSEIPEATRQSWSGDSRKKQATNSRATAAKRDCEAVRQKVSDDRNSSSFLGVDFEADEPATSTASKSPAVLGEPPAESVSIPPFNSEISEATPQSWSWESGKKPATDSRAAAATSDFAAVRQKVSDDRSSSSFLGVDFEDGPAMSAGSNSPSLLDDRRLEYVSMPLFSDMSQATSQNWSGDSRKKPATDPRATAATENDMPRDRTDSVLVSAVSNSPSLLGERRLETVSVPPPNCEMSKATQQNRTSDVGPGEGRPRSSSNVDRKKQQPTDSPAAAAAAENAVVNKLAAKHDEIMKTVEDIMEARRAARNKSWHAWSRRKRQAAKRKMQEGNNRSLLLPDSHAGPGWDRGIR